MEYKYNCIDCNYHSNKSNHWYQHKKTKKHLKHTSDIDISIKYNCNICNYHSNKKQCWYQHNKTKKHIKNQLIEDNRLEQEEIKINKDIKERELNIKEEEIKIKLLQEERLKDELILKQKELELKEKELNNQTIINNNTTNNTINNNNNTININVYGNESIDSIVDTDTFQELMTYLQDIKDNHDNDHYKMIEYYMNKCFIECEDNNTVKYNNMRGNICMIHTGNDKWKAKKITDIVDNRINKLPSMLTQMLYSSSRISLDIPVPTSMDDDVTEADDKKLYLFRSEHRADYQMFRKAKDIIKNICYENKETNKKLNTVKQNHMIDIYNQ